MVKKKIINWLNENYEHGYNERILEIMNEYAENEDGEYVDFEELHDRAIDELEDDGGMFPNGRDYDSEDY